MTELVLKNTSPSQVFQEVLKIMHHCPIVMLNVTTFLQEDEAQMSNIKFD